MPYIVGASCIKDSGLVCEKFTERTENAEISQLGDVIISVVGTLGKMAVNNIGELTKTVKKFDGVDIEKLKTDLAEILHFQAVS